MQVKALHKTNIMSAKFLPQTGDRQAVSCSGDGVIMVSGNIINSNTLKKLKGKTSQFQIWKRRMAAYRTFSDAIRVQFMKLLQ